MDYINRSGNLADMKSRIVSFIKIKGPVLPIHIFKETKTTLLLSSAFLSDLVSEKTLKISDLKVGGSPLYYLPGQEAMLENFYNHLPKKEQEAFLLLKEKKVLKDDEQEPAIRVALRSIKDFAVPFSVKIQDRQFIFWQYFSAGEDEAKNLISEMLEKYAIGTKPKERIEEKPIETEIQVKQKTEEKMEPITTEEKKEQKIEPIFTEKENAEETKKKAKKTPLLEQAKSFLAGRNIELIGIEKSGKKEIFMKIKRDGKEMLLLALDKKKVNDSDILKAFKKAQTLNVPYTILAKGEAGKKLRESIEAHKNLGNIDLFEA